MVFSVSPKETKSKGAFCIREAYIWSQSNYLPSSTWNSEWKKKKNKTVSNSWNISNFETVYKSKNEWGKITYRYLNNI